MPVIISATDTDVLVLMVHIYSWRDIDRPWQMKIDHQNFVNVAAIADHIGSEACNVLPAFHSITGCDTTSFQFRVDPGVHLDGEIWSRDEQDPPEKRIRTKEAEERRRNVEVERLFTTLTSEVEFDETGEKDEEQEEEAEEEDNYEDDWDSHSSFGDLH
eukprot:gene3979-18263_t